MVLDDEKQRELLLGMIKSLNFSGEFIEQFYNLKKSIENATLQAPSILETKKR